MKNKRTKLTAILLSALMAVSTISSVTWAADLFSDGSVEPEVLVEEPFDVASDEEDEEVAEDAILNGISASDIESVEFVYDNYDSTNYTASNAIKATDVIAIITFTTKSGIVPNTQKRKAIKGADALGDDKAATCLAPELAIYSVTIDGTTFLSSEDGRTDAGGVNGSSGTTSVKINAYCKNWYYTNTSNGVGYVESTTTSNKGYIVVPGTKPLGSDNQGHYGHVRGKESAFLVDDSTCEAGVKYHYYACANCGQIVGSKMPTTLGSIVYDDTSLLYKGTLTISKLKELAKKQSNDATEADWEVDLDSDGTSDIWTEIIPANNHVYDYDHPIIVDQKYYYEKLDKVNGKPYKSWTPYNCHMVNGEMVAFTDDDYKIFVANIGTTKSNRFVDIDKDGVYESVFIDGIECDVNFGPFADSSHKDCETAIYRRR